MQTYSGHAPAICRVRQQKSSLACLSPPGQLQVRLVAGPVSYRSCQLQVLVAIAAYKAELADAQSGVMATLVQLTPQGVAPASHQIWQ